MSGYTRWSDIRSAYVEEAGGEEAFEAGKQELLATVVGHRLSQIRRDLTDPAAGRRPYGRHQRPHLPDRAGQDSGQDVLARYAAALGGRLHQAIYFDDGNIAAIA